LFASLVPRVSLLSASWSERGEGKEERLLKRGCLFFGNEHHKSLISKKICQKKKKEKERNKILASEIDSFQYRLEDHRKK